MISECPPCEKHDDGRCQGNASSSPATRVKVKCVRAQVSIGPDPLLFGKQAHPGQEWCEHSAPAPALAPPRIVCDQGEHAEQTGDQDVTVRQKACRGSVCIVDSEKNRGQASNECG